MCTLVRTQGLSGVKLGGGVTVQAPTGEETDGSPFPPHAPGPLCFMKIEIYCQTQKTRPIKIRMNTSLESSLLVGQQGSGGKTSEQGITGIIGLPPNLPGFHLLIDASRS